MGRILFHATMDATVSVTIQTTDAPDSTKSSGRQSPAVSATAPDVAQVVSELREPDRIGSDGREGCVPVPPRRTSASPRRSGAALDRPARIDAAALSHGSPLGRLSAPLEIEVLESGVYCVRVWECDSELTA